MRRLPHFKMGFTPNSEVRGTRAENAFLLHDAVEGY